MKEKEQTRRRIAPGRSIEFRVNEMCLLVR